MPIAEIRRMMAGGWGVPQIDIRDPSLVLYLPLWYPDSETTGSTIISKDKNRHSGAVTAATWASTGRSFNGTTAFISCGTSSVLVPAQITFLARLYITESNAQVYTIAERRDGNDGYFVGHENLRFFFEHNGNAGADKITSDTNLTLNTWIHLAITSDGTNQNMYQNLALVATGGTTDIVTNSVALRLGQRTFGAGGAWYKGTMGDVLIYNRVLTLSEIKHIYQFTRGRFF